MAAYVFFKEDSTTIPLIADKGETLKEMRNYLIKHGELHKVTDYMKFFNNGKSTNKRPLSRSKIQNMVSQYLWLNPTA